MTIFTVTLVLEWEIAVLSRSKQMEKRSRDFNPRIFLSTEGVGRRIMSYRKRQSIFTQGQASDAVFVIQTGFVRLSAESPCGPTRSRRSRPASDLARAHFVVPYVQWGLENPSFMFGKLRMRLR
jgi:hypothetical protein